MLKRIFIAWCLFFVAHTGCANELSADLDRDGTPERFHISRDGQQSIVQVYSGNKNLGSFVNLVAAETSVSSDLVSTFGGGVAVVADSDGSRNKYHVIVPIIKVNDRLMVNCIYKSVYDSVDEKNFVGAICKSTDLRDLDFGNLFNLDGLYLYASNKRWSKSKNSNNCVKESEFLYGSFYISKCTTLGNNRSASIIIVSSKTGEKVFSVIGYDFFPSVDGDKFIISAMLSEQAIIFEGSLKCLSSTENFVDVPDRDAVIGAKIKIKYRLDNNGRCKIGSYYYGSSGASIMLSGMQGGIIDYVMERSSTGISTGLFLLDHNGNKLEGVWLSVPPKKVFPIR